MPNTYANPIQSGSQSRQIPSDIIASPIDTKAMEANQIESNYQVEKKSIPFADMAVGAIKGVQAGQELVDEQDKRLKAQQFSKVLQAGVPALQQVQSELPDDDPVKKMDMSVAAQSPELLEKMWKLVLDRHAKADEKNKMTSFQQFIGGEDVAKPQQTVTTQTPVMGANPQVEKDQADLQSGRPSALMGLAPADIQTGMTETTMTSPVEYEKKKPTRDQMQQKALELGIYGDPNIKTFMDDTNPTKTLEGQKEIFGIKDAAQSKRELAKQEYMTALEEFRQGRMDYRALMSAKAAVDRSESKNELRKDLQPTEIEKLTSLGNKRDNVQYIVNNFQDDFSGPGTWTQNKIGKIIGTSEEQILWWQGYSSFVNEIRNAMFGASLTPGEKSEFEKTIVTEAMNSSIARKNLARQLQIVNNAITRQGKVYSMGNKNQDQVSAALGEDLPSKQNKTGSQKIKSSSGKTTVEFH